MVERARQHGSWRPLTLVDRLQRTVAVHGDREALIADDERLTWSEVLDASRQIASGLLALGVAPGDRVALWLPNRVEWPLCWLAAAHLGALTVPVNTRYKAAEAGYLLGHATPRVLVMLDRWLGIDYRALLDEACEQHGAPRPPHVVVIGEPWQGTISFAQLQRAGADVEDAELDARRDAVVPQDPTIIVYTSGTTGFPKGAVHSHAILRNEYAIADWMGHDERTRLLGHMPFFHVAGGFTGLLPALITGGAVVLMERWDAGRALQLIERERVSSIGGIPTHYVDLLAHPALDATDTSSLQVGWIGGATIAPDVVRGAREQLGVRTILPVYGMTETTSTTTYPRPGDPDEIVLSGRGVPISDFELRVVDPATRAERAPGEEGEIEVRGHLVMQGYYRDPEATAKVLDRDGWFRTGDLGVLGDDGYLAVTGRRSDMFIVGGSNAYPAEIERLLAAHPGVRQVAVVGVPDARLGEVGFAFVQLHPEADLTEEELVRYARSQMSDFKVPRRVAFVAQLPLTSTGKVERHTLRELAAAR
ncbi:AMP-binding protein [Conexibacter sp. CPCC 206217]|uniref:AMP-binding protein n=1 Tax=Conexibacter sp. CPCC 206217 TaxID=3064574 RepID=UPI00272BC5F3|nr:AMP-binding protein [Conexibacter sp. CPCC 206217]